MFVTFEGGEGSGKTTVISKIKEILMNEGFDVITTREPGGSKIAEKIRTLLLDKNNIELTPHTEALLFAASRAQHLDEVVIPALKKQQIILCDRYLDSSIAYQAFGRNLGIDFINKINSYALEYTPELTFYLELDPTIGQTRVKTNRAHKVDRLDLEVTTFHQQVAKGYQYIAQNDPNRVKVINANRNPEIITDEIINYLRQVL